MTEENKLANPEMVYRRSTDKQRVVITGMESKMISSLVVYVLKSCTREFDFIRLFPGEEETSLSQITDAPLVIIQERARPDSSILKYHHHIAVISEISPQDHQIATQFADATPKGGIVIYSETEPAKSIGKKERPDATSLGYHSYLHEVENGNVVLISSHQERFPIRLTGESNLRGISAAKEILKKIGITSEQFYHAIPEFAG